MADPPVQVGAVKATDAVVPETDAVPIVGAAGGALGLGQHPCF